MDAACIAVKEVDAERSFPLRLRMTEIFACGQQPERIHNVRDLLLETTRETSDVSTSVFLLLFMKKGIEHHSFQCGCRHTLPIDGVETAHRVAQDHEPFWETAKSLVVTPTIGRELMNSDRCYRFGIFDRLIEVELRQATGKCEKTCLIVGWIITYPADHRHDPAILFDGGENACPFLSRRSRVDSQDIVVKVTVLRATIDTCRIADINLDCAFLYFIIAKSGQPLRSLRAAPAGVHNEIGRKNFFVRLTLAMSYLNSGNLCRIIIGTELDHIALIEKAYIASRCYPLTYISFQQWAALTVEGDAAPEARFPRPKVIPMEVGNRIDGDTSILDERGEEVWKEVLHHR